MDFGSSGAGPFRALRDPERAGATEGQNYHFHIKILIKIVMHKSEARNIEFRPSGPVPSGVPERGRATESPNYHFPIEI